MGGSSAPKPLRKEELKQNIGATVGGLVGGPLGYIAGKELFDRPKKDAMQMMADQQNIASKYENELVDQQSKFEEEKKAIESGAEEDATKTSKRDQQRSRQKALARQKSGRQGTILTSPLGSVGDESGVTKTLLGN